MSADHPATPGGATTRKWISGLVGFVLVAASIGFLVNSAAGGWQRIGDRVAHASLIPLAGAALIAAVAMTGIATLWWLLLRRLPSTPPQLAWMTAAGWYFVGESAKYIPGGIWPVVGRGELARRGGIERKEALWSVLWSLALFFGTGAAIAGPCLAVTRLDLWLGFVVPVLVGVVLWPGVIDALAAKVPALAGRLWRPDPATVIRQLVGSAAIWCVIGATNAVAAGAFDFHYASWRIAMAGIVAWVAGFAAVPVPGGAGVREAVFVATCGLGRPDAVLLAVTVRLVFVAVDLLGLVVGGAVLARSAQRQRSNGSAAPPPSGAVS